MWALVAVALGDVLGLRRAFLAALVLFTLASVAAGLAPNETVLFAAQVLQGVGGALITPAGLALLIELFPDPRQRATAIGIWGAIGAIPVALGPVLGGVLSQYDSWNWIFLVNAPVGVFAVVLSAVSMPRSQRHRSSGAGVLRRRYHVARPATRLSPVRDRGRRVRPGQQRRRRGRPARAQRCRVGHVERVDPGQRVAWGGDPRGGAIGGLSRRHRDGSGPVHRRISGGDGGGWDRRRARGAAAGVGFAVGAARQSVLGGGG
jgi:hypothetical protein